VLASQTLPRHLVTRPRREIIAFPGAEYQVFPEPGGDAGPA